ncbi:RNA polymerase sigma factor [Sphingobacterium bovistauri]|uniref:RNA polymerase sigma factor SigS n=1 Tax=Sphingobacterium bovistauri TaxID=2781959 RepID=A0ABS7Z6B0_9SPHI|nr:sigma-70 family RNA polymerase sigma factor [Sphingobacterium bovistauri]MCA5005690.1 sigma-70 family RNA polymerase sigma factor [Sphingobacterium bovistauri]
MSNLNLLTDEVLYQKVSFDDNNKAFTELYNRYKKPLIAYALAKVSNSIAEDLIHDLFVRIWTNRNTVQIENFSSYIFRALRNRIIDFIAYNDTAQKYVDSLEDFSLQQFSYFADFKIREETFLNKIDSLLIKYGTKSQQIVKLRMQGYSNQEIAEQLGISEKTVRNQYSLLMRYLREKIPLLLFLSFMS